MTRRELILNKLQELSDDEVERAIKQLTHHVKARLRFRSLFDRTKSGAHGENNLGMNAIDFYVGESVKRLYDPNGWNWKFEKFSLAEQLSRIANKLISENVKSFKNKKEEMPVIDNRDISDIFELEEITEDIINDKETVCSKLIELSIELSKNDDNLQYFTIRYFEKASFALIAEEMNISIEQVYVLRKKLVRRLINIKEKLTS